MTYPSKIEIKDFYHTFNQTRFKNTILTINKIMEQITVSPRLIPRINTNADVMNQSCMIYLIPDNTVLTYKVADLI